MRLSTWITGWLICVLLSKVSGELVCILCTFLVQCIPSKSRLQDDDNKNSRLPLGTQCECVVCDIGRHIQIWTQALMRFILILHSPISDS